MQKLPTLNLLYRKQDLHPTHYIRDTCEELQGNQDEDHIRGPIIFTLSLTVNDCLKLRNLYNLGSSQQVESCAIQLMHSRPISFSISYMHEADELLLYDFATCVDIMCQKDFTTGNSTDPWLILVLYHPYQEEEAITVDINMKEVLNFLEYHNKINMHNDN